MMIGDSAGLCGGASDLSSGALGCGLCYDYAVVRKDLHVIEAAFRTPEPKIDGLSFA